MNLRTIQRMSAAAIVLGLMAGCSSANGGNEDKNGGEGQKPVEITMYHWKGNLQDKMEQLAKEFNKEYPHITVKMEAGADYDNTLKAKLAAGQLPDIFQNAGYNGAVQWAEHLEDLSNEPWVGNVYPFAKEGMTIDGKLLGMPINLEGYGFLYSKKIFAEQGITELPKTLSELKAVAEKLKAANITPFSDGYQEAWVLSVHNFNIPLAYHSNPDQLLEQLKSGETEFKDVQEFRDWVDMLEMTIKYGQANPLTTDYNTQISLFATGKTAMMQQGNWAQPEINKIDEAFDIGVLPMPINDDADTMDKLAIGVPTNWVVSKSSPAKEEAKLFLNWMVSSDIGKKYIADEFLYIPALDNIPYDANVLGGIAADLIAYSQDEKTIGMHASKWPEGFLDAAASSAQKFVAGNSNKDQLLDELQKSLAAAVAKQGTAQGK